MGFRLYVQTAAGIPVLPDDYIQRAIDAVYRYVTDDGEREEILRMLDLV